MPVLSALFLVLALTLAVVLGPQTLPWSWGPAMIALGIAALAAVPAFWRSVRTQADHGLLLLCAATAGWFAWRAWGSPVAELGHADLLLLCGATGAFVSIRGITGNARAERILIWGVALLLLANVVVVARQVFQPPFSPLFPVAEGSRMVSGFYAHYNHAANFLIGTSLMAGAAALYGRHAAATRIFWALLAVAGLAGVYYTKSRGGIFGAAIGCAVFVGVALAIAKRRDSKYFAPALIALPLIGMAVAAFWIFGWEQRSGGNTAALLDNNIRLYMLGIAMSCIGLHPLAGGGSRSFSWESFRFIDIHAHRHAGNRPEMPHNELVQAATDYGLIGAGLLVLLLVILVFATVLRVIFEDRPRESDGRDVWRLGAIAALAGMFVQSSFSFVFHLMPDVILLGICLGMMSRGETRMPNLATRSAGLLLSLAALACAAVLLPAGWKGTRVYQTLWPLVSGKVPETAVETRIDILTEAIRIWPQSDFHQDRGAIFQQLAMSSEEPAAFRENARLAVEDYLMAGVLHPHEPSHPINAGNLQSLMGLDDAAEASFARGIRLQGGMESGFRGHFSLAKHLLRKAGGLFDAGNAAAALASLERAAEEIETACMEMHWIMGDMNEPRIAIHSSLGGAREAAGDLTGALACYDFAASLRDRRAHYLAGLLIGKMAVDAWKQRKPEKALGGFIEARRRIHMAAEFWPEGVTADDRSNYLAYLDQMIAFLQGAKVRAEEWKPGN
ncbi:MAG: O-antigen ligase family protein [Akkermansiaceae bacterium]|nr:O-antigen ligase family protein [Akkermansiaceae bacterium]